MVVREKPMRVFTVGLQTPTYALVREGLFEGPPLDRKYSSGVTWWIQFTRYLWGGMGESPAGQVTPWWDGLLDPWWRVPRVLVGGDPSRMGNTPVG